MLGLGVSSIGRVGPTYYQNAKTLPDYYAALDAGRLPVVRGMELSTDDLLRRSVIQRLACDFRLTLKNFEAAYNIDFRRYFKAEMADLAKLAEDGLVELVDDGVVVTPKGRVLVRAVCMVFDRYLREKRAGGTYSKVL
jgi:oxygen-independent coproporphyrinogen-3 oxidase